MKKEIWWIIFVPSAVLWLLSVFAILTDATGLNFLNPGKKVGWPEVVWAATFGAIAIYSGNKAIAMTPTKKAKKKV